MASPPRRPAARRGRPAGGPRRLEGRLLREDDRPVHLASDLGLDPATSSGRTSPALAKRPLERRDRIAPLPALHLLPGPVELGVVGRVGPEPVRPRLEQERPLPGPHVGRGPLRRASTASTSMPSTLSARVA